MSGLEWRAVPAGPFAMGSDAGGPATDPDEAPRHRVACPGFRIGRTPVTNAEYRRFVDATSRPPPSHWPAGAIPDGLEAHPVTMAGNVWEWVSSLYAPYPYDARDGRENPRSGDPRVLRGGSYASPTGRHLRCAARSRSAPGRRSPHIGFRVARPVS